jgi:hypothetical protein
VTTLRILPADHLTPFLATPAGAGDARLLGVLVGDGQALVAQRSRSVPRGAWGNLTLARLPHGLEELPLRARVRRDGGIEVAPALEPELTKDGASIRPNAIARTLEQQAAVSRAAVRLEQTESGLPALVGYVAPKPGATFTQTELRQHLRARLPERMLPGQFVELDTLPLREDGSIRLEGLPSPFARSRRDHHVEPKTPSEQLLARCWREALKLPAVGLRDNFFDLGGHSLLCFQVLADVERETGKRLSPRLFLLNTLEQVARALDEESTTPVRPPEPPAGGLASRFKQKLGGLLGRR